MKKIIVFSFLCFSLAASVFCAVDELAQGMDGTISLDLRSIDVVDALKYLAIKAGINIVTSKNVAGRVNLMVEGVPVKDAFDIMLRSNGLAYDVQGNIYNVMTEAEYTALYGKKYSDVRQVKILHLAYAIPEQVFKLCDTLRSENGRVLVDAESGAIVLMDSPQKLEEIEKALKQFEKKNVVEVFNINYASAKEIAEQLKSQLEAKKVGSVRADERSNQVIVQTLPERMNQIRELIAKLDRKTKEVLINAKIIKVKLTDDITRAVEWEGLFDVARRSGLTYVGSYPFSAVQPATDAWRSRNQVFQDVGNVGSYPFSGTTSDFDASTTRKGFQEMHVGVVGKQDFDVLIRNFQDIGETEIISTPKIIVTNNQEARIHVGEKQAYVTTTTTTGQTTSTVSEDVTFVDVGTQLFVTPTINDEGYILLKLKTEISSVISVLVTPTQNEIPIIDSSLAETTVLTKNGTSVVIGGLRRMEKTNTVNRTPFLSGIPFLGNLFTSKNPARARTELLILITPTLVTGDVLMGYTGEVIEEAPLKKVKEYEADVKTQDLRDMSKSITLKDVKK